MLPHDLGDGVPGVGVPWLLSGLGIRDEREAQPASLREACSAWPPALGAHCPEVPGPAGETRGGEAGMESPKGFLEIGSGLSLAGHTDMLR